VTPRFFLRYLARESRGSRGRLAFFIFCLAIGVAAVVAVASLSDSLDLAVRGEARQLLAGDVKVSSRRPLPPELDPAVATLPGTQRTDLRELVTVVAVDRTASNQPASSPAVSSRPVSSQLVELKVIEGQYPFYGDLELEPNRPLAELLGATGAVVAPDLLQRLDLAVGDPLEIGGEEFRVTGTVLAEPDRLAINLTMGPRVFLSGAGFDRTRLETLGSRIGYRALLRTPDSTTPEQLTRLVEALEDSLPETGAFNVETYAEAQPALRRGMRQVERFLGLVALVSLLVGGIGVAQTIRAWLASRMDAIAVLKCLGLRPREVVALYFGQSLVLGAIGSLVGAVVGALLPWTAPLILGDLIPNQAVGGLRPWAIFQGLALGIGVAAFFSLPPLLTARGIPPIRVLRRDAEPLQPSRPIMIATALTLAIGIALAATVQSGSWILGLQFTGGALAVTALLALGATGLSRLARSIPRDRGKWWFRHGLAALGRPGSGTVGAIIALGLGVMVVLAMALVERHLYGQLATDLPEDSPSAFLVDIQPDQWEGVQGLLADASASTVDSVPVVIARLAAIDGTPVEELAKKKSLSEETTASQRTASQRSDRQAERDQNRRWALTREQRLTYLAQLPEDNEILEGELWSDPAVQEVSVEQDFAEELGVGVGSTLSFDIQGVPLQLAVTSIRSVRWETFRLNFFLVVEPGVLEEAPQFRIAAARLGPDQEQGFQDRLAAAFPNVTMLRIREILEKIAGVLSRLGLGVRFLGALTVLTGLVILGGAVTASASRRGREAALLKTLGLTRGGVLAVFAVEYTLVGLVAGLVGALAGGGLAWVVLTRGMEIDWVFMPLPFATAVFGSAVLTALAGCAASARALARPPVSALRSEG